MTDNDDQDLVPYFMPALGALFVMAEDKKGEPLTPAEVTQIRDSANCMMVRREIARKMEESRGWTIDPENCWHDWQNLRRELGRKPDLDPGPKFDQVRSSDLEYQRTIADARASLEQFRRQLPEDGSPRTYATVKTEVRDSDASAFMWLCNVRRADPNFIGELFEVPPLFRTLRPGDEITVSPDTLLDWMINEEGVIQGGISLRYHRAKLSEEERVAYDEYVGAVRFVSKALSVPTIATINATAWTTIATPSGGTLTIQSDGSCP